MSSECSVCAELARYHNAWLLLMAWAGGPYREICLGPVIIARWMTAVDDWAETESADPIDLATKLNLLPKA